MSAGEMTGLTARQGEFLQAVQELSRDGGGVHYTDVAERVGVSRWTAYDILTSLAQKGFVLVEREQRGIGSLVGRCRVLFRPARPFAAFVPQALPPAPAVPPGICGGFPGDPGGRTSGDFSGDASGDASGGPSGCLPEGDGNRVLSKWEARLLRLQRDIRERGVWAVLQEVVAELGGPSQPVVFCAVLTLALLLALRALVRGAEASGWVASLLSWLSAEAGVVVFVGAVAGLLLQHGLPRELHTPLLEQLPLFEQEVNGLGEEGKEDLRQFTLVAVREVWGLAASA